MKNNKKPKIYRNKHFLSGAGFASLLLVALSAVLYTGGWLQIASEDAFAASKVPPSTYTQDPPDPNHWDQTAPTISFVSPADGSTIDTSWRSGSFYVTNVKLAASDNDRIMVVYTFVDGNLDGIHAYNATEYQVQARIPAKAGKHTIKAIAYDYNRNPATAQITVTVPKK